MHNYIHIKQSLTQNKYFRVVIKWLAILLILGAFVFGIRSYVQSIYQKELKKYQPQIQVIKDNFRESVKNSPQSSYELTLTGVKLLKNNQTEYAVMVLEAAAEKDPKYRDAALFAGYAYLRFAQEINEQKNRETEKLNYNNVYRLTSNDYSQKAIEYLNKAKDLDSIYPLTYELLAIAYQNLGNSQNSESAYKKSVEFK